MSLTTFEEKPLLVLRGAKHFFVEHARRAEFEKLPGRKWKPKAKAHFLAGQFFVVEQDGFCRACRVARSNSACRSVRVAVLDISASPMPAGAMAQKSARTDAKTYRGELRDFVKQLPDDLQCQLREAALSPDEIQQLVETARQRPWRIFRKKVEWINPNGKRVALERIASWQALSEDQDEPTKMVEEVRRLLAEVQARNTKK